MKAEKPFSLEIDDALSDKTNMQPRLETVKKPVFKMTKEQALVNGSVVKRQKRIPIRMIIVDDSIQMREAVQALLEPHPDLELVATLEDGRAALEQAIALQPDLILTDYSMPGMNGVELADAVHSRYPNTKIIVTSAYDRQYIEMATVGLGGHVFIHKSRLAEEFFQEVERMFPWLGSRLTGELHAQQG